MVLARFIVVLVGAAALFLVLFSSCAEGAGELGVAYGRDGNNLPNPASVVQLLKQNNISMVRLYNEPDAGVLTSLANTGIKVMVMLPNDDVAAAASSPSFAAQWVQNNVKRYHPTTQINGVAVGNEVFDMKPDLSSVLVQAMTNVQEALAKQGLADAVKVSTPIALDALKQSSPPSAGRFKDDIAERVMRPMLGFLQRTGSFLTVNMYPCLTYMNQPDMNRDFALGNPNAPTVQDGNTMLGYDNLLDSQRDAIHFAMEALGFPSLRVTHGEHGCASGGRPHHGGRRLGDGGDAGAAAPSVANAQTYMNNLMNRVLSGRTGTPHRPDADMDVYIFALFTENLKGDAGDIETHYGLFNPKSMQKVYQFVGFGTSRGGGSWCVANAAVGDARLQAALDYACGHGADCTAIQPGAACFQPDTKLAHASYAFDSYYQRNGRANGACDFDGAAYVVYQQPAGCRATASWCVANTAAGDTRLQAALDWACGNGADCSAIQPGATCFEPNTKAAHASYAFNDYYQRKGRASGTCDFSGAASVVYQEPAGTCRATSSWCVANAAVGDARLQAALDYACGHGADCSSIQPGASCFDPNTKAAHASHAFNSYYQRNHRASGTCDFSGAASVVYQAPKIGNCVLPSGT